MKSQRMINSMLPFWLVVSHLLFLVNGAVLKQGTQCYSCVHEPCDDFEFCPDFCYSIAADLEGAQMYKSGCMPNINFCDDNEKELLSEGYGNFTCNICAVSWCNSADIRRPAAISIMLIISNALSNVL